jgi:hypothetical protein
LVFGLRKGWRLYCLVSYGIEDTITTKTRSRPGRRCWGAGSEGDDQDTITTTAAAITETRRRNHGEAAAITRIHRGRRPRRSTKRRKRRSERQYDSSLTANTTKEFTATGLKSRRRRRPEDRDQAIANNRRRRRRPRSCSGRRNRDSNRKEQNGEDQDQEGEGKATGSSRRSKPRDNRPAPSRVILRREPRGYYRGRKSPFIHSLFLDLIEIIRLQDC